MNDTIESGEIFVFKTKFRSTYDDFGTYDELWPLLVQIPSSHNSFLKISIVVVPEGTAQITSTAVLDEFIVFPTPYLYHCLLSNSTNEVPFTRKELAIVDGGQKVQLTVFRDTDSSISNLDALPAYEVIDPVTLANRYVVIDKIPGDIGYSPIRHWFTVSSQQNFTTVSEILASNLIVVDTFIETVVALGDFSFITPISNLSAFATSNQSGTFAEVSVDGLLIPMSLLPTGNVDNETQKISSGFMMVIEGQHPVIDSIPGDPQFSFARAVVSLSRQTATITSHEMVNFSSLAHNFSGDIVNVVVVDGDVPGALRAWYRNETVWVLILESLPNGCELLTNTAGLLQFQRNNESTPIKSLFKTRPREFDEIFYSPFVSSATIDVDASFSDTSSIPVTSWDATPQISTSPNNDLFNAPRRLKEPAATDLNNRFEFASSRNMSITVDWHFSDCCAFIDVALESVSHLHNPLVIGFHGKLPFAGTLLVVHFDLSGNQCTRQVRGSVLSPNELIDVTATNPLQLLKTPVFSRKIANGGKLEMLSITANITNFSNTTSYLTAGVLDIDSSRLMTCSTLSLSGYSFLDDSISEMQSAPVTWVPGISNPKQQGRLLSSLENFGLPSTISDPPMNLQIEPERANLTLPLSNQSKGAFRCDSSFSFSWSFINASTNAMYFSIVPPSNLNTSMYFGLGIGSTSLSGSDAFFVYLDARNSSLLVSIDTKCSASGSSTFCLRSKYSDGVVSVFGNESLWVVRRSAIVFDPASKLLGTSLVGSTIDTTAAFGGIGLSVNYVAFANTPAFIFQDNSVGMAPLYRLRNETDLNSTADFWPPSEAQLSLSQPWRYYLSAVAPGTVGYSDLRNIVDVFIPSNYVGELPQRVLDLPETWKRQPSRPLNCPMVHRSSSLSTSVATAAVMLPVMFDGVTYSCVAFLSPQFSNSSKTQRVYELRSSTNLTLEYIFEFTPDAANYTPFGHMYAVIVPTALQGALQSAEAILHSGLPLIDLDSFVNFPIISSSSTPAPTTVVTPSVEESYTSLYEHSLLLFADVSLDQRILLVWNYNIDLQTIDVAVLAKNTNGYISLGFSSSSTSQMEDSDIVLGYINSATLEGCVRVLYSAFPTSAPSGTPTLEIRSSSIQRSSDYLILSFSRDFDGSAHSSGVIPSPATTGVATGRVLFASLLQYVASECASTEFSSLYHGTSPHGSVLIDWAASTSSTVATPAPSTSVPSTTAPTVITLTAFNIQARPVYVRGALGVMVCAPSSFPVATQPSTESEFGIPTFPAMYQFVFNGTVLSSILPLIATYPQSSDYSGAWRIHLVNLSGAYSTAASIANITSFAALQTLVNATTAIVPTDYYLDCPIVSQLTTAPNTTLRALFFNGQSISCLQLSQESLRTTAKFSPSSKVAPLWNTSFSVSIIDDPAAMFFKVFRVNSSSNATFRAEDVSTLPRISTGDILQCRIIVNTTKAPVLFSNLSLALQPITLTKQSATFGNRTVSFIALPSIRGGRCANLRSGWSRTGVATLYLLRNVSKSSNANDSLQNLNATALHDILADSSTLAPLLSIRVRNASIGLRNRTVSVVNTTTNVTVNTTIQDTVFAEIVDTAVESRYFVDAMPVVNESTYCDGVWQVVMVDVSSVPAEDNVTQLNATTGTGNATDSGNGTIIPAWHSGEFVPSARGDGWYIPWWANVNTIRSLPQRLVNGTLLGSMLHCPLIHKNTTVEGGAATIQRLSVLTAGGFVADCLNFGWLNEATAGAVLPNLVNVSTAGTFVMDAIPGSRYFSSMFWLRELRGVSRTPTFVNVSLLTNDSYQVAYVLVLSVTGGTPGSAVSSLTSWNLTQASWNWATQGLQIPITAVGRSASDSFGMMSLTNYWNMSVFPWSAMQCLDRYSANCSLGLRNTQKLLISALSVIYVFRRGTTIGSPSVSLNGSTTPMRSVALHSPLQSYYNAANGSWGYTDPKRVVVVTVPPTYSGSEIGNASLIPNTWVQTTAANVVGHSFLLSTASGVTPLSPPSTFGRSMWCPATSVWANGQLWSTVDCGWGPSTKSMAVASLSMTTQTPPTSSTLLFIGSNVTSIASFAPLHINNLNLKLAYSVYNTSSTRQCNNSAFVVDPSTPLPELVQLLVIPQHFPTMLPESGNAMVKFVFRRGPALSSSGDVAPPVISWAGAGIGSSNSVPSIARVFVVNVGAFMTSADLYDMTLTTEYEIRSAAIRNCWPILETLKIEASVLLYYQSNISNADLATYQARRSPSNRLEVVPVFANGMPRLQIASRILVEDVAGRTSLSPRALVAADGSMFLAPKASPSWLPIVHATASGSYATFTNPSQLLGTMDTLVSLLEAPSAATVSNFMLVQVVDEAYAPYVTPPAQGQTLTRQTAYFNDKQLAAYIFSDRNLYNPTQPSPLYIFRRLSSTGAVLSTTGAPLLDALPGHATYNDLHELVYCDLPSTSSTLPAPTSIAAMRRMLAQRTILAPKQSGIIKHAPIVGAGTTVELQDQVANGGSVLGPSAVVFEGSTLAMLDFGITTVGFAPELSIAMRLLYQLNSFPVPDGWILNSDPWTNTTTYSFLRNTHCTIVPNWLLPNTITSQSAATKVALQNATTASTLCNRNLSVAVVGVTTVTAASNGNISTTGPTLINWVYGTVNYSSATGVVTRSAPLRSGSGTIDFFTGNVTGSTSVSSDWINITNGSTTVTLSDSLTLSWELGTLGATSSTARRSFHTLDTSPIDIATYAPTELYAQFKITVTADVWVGLGLTNSGGMSGADMWIAYASQSVPAGSVSSGYYYELSDRHADPTNAHNTPIKDTINDLELLSLELTSSGYVIVFRRRLITTDSENDIDIQNTLQTMLWAYGPYLLTQQTPNTHTNRGLLLVNLFTGQNISVEQRGFTFWYVAMIMGVTVFIMLIGFLARLLSPGYLMYKRPLLFLWASRGLRRMTVAEILVLFMLWGAGAAWGYGNFTNYDVSRRSDGVILAIGNTAQYLLYFGLFPTARNNILITGVFRSSWHKLQHWITLLLLPALVLSWVHGGIMMYRQPHLSFHTTSGICSIIGLSLLTLAYALWHSSDFVRRGILRRVVSLRRQHTLYLIVIGGAVALLCIHTNKLALGWIPWFILFFTDHVWRWKDFRSRFGTVVAQGAFSTIAAAFELRIFSPWKSWWTRPFVVSAPGQFILVDMEGVDEGPIALSISSRVLQDPKQNFATATFHLKPPSAGAQKRITKDREGYLGARERLRRLAVDQHLQGRFCRIEGPYGGIGLRLKWYKSLLLVGGGIGASTCLSLLEAMTFQPDFYAQDTSVETVTLVLVAKEPEEFAIFASELFELLSAPRAFDLQLLLHCTSLKYHQPPTALSDGNFHSLVDVASPPRRATAPPVDFSNPSALHPLFEHVPIFFHRPNWTQIITAEQIAAGKRKETRLAVHVNGPSTLTSEVLESSDALSYFGGVQIHVDYEQYDLCV
ncbi:Hypothetical protein, putative [Bodo saltans]|uniref:DOMON domain-containing protein n=1 Tax=Bodo saltans TaxID=75058 RepID=A0A0S4J3S8_BODSA|nr:Hypothetical protein, putative [Bodo saltans]|eukprot:CUG10079.1 Hypothetical protein, putative [Bodo saltans]